MLPQIGRLPERSVALRARVVSALLVYRAHMPRQIARMPKRSIALRARVVSALLVHRAHMRLQRARLPKRKPWGAKQYFTIGRELVMLSKPAANLIMDLGRRVQAHLQT